MASEGSLTEWARLEVQSMIDATIARYDEKQDRRHRENTLKLDRNAEAVSGLRDSMYAQFTQLKHTIDEATGGSKLVAWGIPIFVSILAIIAEIIRRK